MNHNVLIKLIAFTIVIGIMSLAIVGFYQFLYVPFKKSTIELVKEVENEMNKPDTTIVIHNGIPDTTIVIHK